MRNLLKHRQQGEGTPFRGRTGSIFDTPTRPTMTHNDSTRNFVRSLDVLAMEADKDLLKALSSQDNLQNELSRLAEEFKEARVFLWMSLRLRLIFFNSEPWSWSGQGLSSRIQSDSVN